MRSFCHSPSSLISSFRLLFAITFVIIPLVSAAATLPKDEVEILRQIAEKVGKKNWDFKVDPCSGLNGWANTSQPDFSLDAVTCDCTFSNNTLCHVVDISLKTQNLPGTLPPEAVKLPYLQVFNLDRDLLSHSIPSEWGSWTKLINMSLLANRLTGSLPKELANIPTLSSITVEYNQLSGNLAPELGNMPSIQRFLLSSNFFTGEIPATYAKLTTLIDFRIPDNRFTGKIPEFIGKWTNLTRLEIQGSGLSGPIPQGIAALTNMTNLKISDLKGSSQPFPPLSNLRNLKILILRNCNIVGELPEYISGFTSLSVLDLSFNYLSGRIPISYASLTKVKYMYLTGNSLSGTIPDWMFSTKSNIDLSYNNLTLTSNVSNCQQGNVNLFASSVGSHNKGIVPCLSSLQCPKKYSGFHINCGGKEFNDGSIIYEEDTDVAGPANFYHRNGTNWAFSSTGHFIDGVATYITTNTSQLVRGTSQLYLDARLSPLSLTYYGFCLENGKYMVDLHFAEITFTHDRTYTTLGRRIFDVYVQGKLALKDFDIAAAARGAGKSIVKSLPAAVDNSTLEIRFYWAGKGTNAIPVKGVYGPLVSAISVKSKVQA